jgi:hypothetical protein
MNTIKLLIILVISNCLFQNSELSAAELTDPIVVSGKVTIWNDIPLENIKVTASKSKQEVFTNARGEFSIEIGKKDKLRFTGDGFITKKVTVKDPNKKIKVEMALISNDFSEDDNMVNNGFHYIPQIHRTTAIERLKEKRDNEFASYNSVWDIIRGRIAGVIVRNNEAYFREGLSGSISTQSTPAVIVLNGSRIISSTVTNMDPKNVKDVTLLKGGAAALYGGSGGTGVIVITSK